MAPGRTRAAGRAVIGLFEPLCCRPVHQTTGWALGIDDPGGLIGLAQSAVGLGKVKTECGLKGVLFEGVRYDAGHKLGYLRANIGYALARPEMRDGVLDLLREMLAAEKAQD